jgi:WD40 repeat protein
LGQIKYIDWCLEDIEQEYRKLFDACRLPAKPLEKEVEVKVIQLDCKRLRICAYAFSPDGQHVLTGCRDNTLRVWAVDTGKCLRVLKGHSGQVASVLWSADQRHAISASDDKTMRLWDVGTEQCLRLFEGHTSDCYCLAWSVDQHYAVSGSRDKTLRFWDLESVQCLRVLEGHTAWVRSVSLSADQRRIISGSNDKTMRLWDLETGSCLHVFEGHTGWVKCVAWSPDQYHALSSGEDTAIRLWNVETGLCLRVLEGHTTDVRSIVWCDQYHAISADDNGTVMLWNIENGLCLYVLEAHSSGVRTVVWRAETRSLFSGDESGNIRVWDFSKYFMDSPNRALVGKVITTVALAGQIYKEYSAKCHGLDMEIEFKDDEGKPTGKKLYLQLKSGDSLLREQEKSGQCKIFNIQNKEYAVYWMKQAFPVFLVITDDEGELMWMEVRDLLKRESKDGRMQVKQIIFDGEKFSLGSINHWRSILTSEQMSLFLEKSFDLQ